MLEQRCQHAYERRWNGKARRLQPIGLHGKRSLGFHGAQARQKGLAVKSVGKEFALAAVACGLLVACTANIRTAAPKQPADVAGATAAATVKEDAPASTPTETQFQTAARENKCADSSFVETHTPLDPQENGYWCWAASAQMVEAFFDNKVKQCVI